MNHGPGVGVFNAVTLEGDVVAKAGTFTGGYQDEARSRTTLWQNLREQRAQVRWGQKG